ncbi:MAG: stage 0 sporulation protein [Clostridiales bacterium]|nr:stage 0 sporulation protein [Clostridiales bacterium]
MAAVVGIRFKNAGKLYYFDPGKFWPIAGSFVIVETARGLEYGQVITGVREVEDELIPSPLKPVVRIATDEDAAHAKENITFEKEAYDVCQHKIQEHKLDMKLVGVEQTFDNTKILFYFTANGRVDFRSLVKDLASVFHTRIELRQIGVRDEAKMLGGLGPCGRPICCGSFLGDFQPVSIKMAKEQNLSLNPTKISGVCGRLMCCLKFEQDHYEATRKRMPKQGKDVETPDGFGIVLESNVLKEVVTVRIRKGDTSEIKSFPLEDIKWTRPAAQPASDAKPREKAPEARQRPQKEAVKKPKKATQGEEPSGDQQEKPAEITTMEPVQQSDNWRRAVEDALDAATKKD